MPWRPGSGTPNRVFYRVSETVWRAYHRRLREIQLSWVTDPPREVEVAPGYSRPEYDLEFEERLEFNARMREAERDQLRTAIVESLKLGYLVNESGERALDEYGFPVSPYGPYLLPVGPPLRPKRGEERPPTPEAKTSLPPPEPDRPTAAERVP